MISMFSWSKALAVLLAVSPLAAQADGFTASPTDGISYKSSDGNIQLKIGGRLHLDAATFNEDKAQLDNDWMVRRARLSLRADLHKDWRLSAQYDLADAKERFRTLWLRYAGFDHTRITAGQFQEPFSLEESTSSNNMIFMERSLANALAPGTNVGIGVHHWGDNWGAEGGAFWETDIDDADPFAAKEGYGFSGRFTIAPIEEKRKVLHLGASASYRIPDDDDRLRIRSQPESDVTDHYFVSTGRMRNVDNTLSTGVEAAMTWAQFSVQGEYIQTQVFRYGDRDDETFDGGHLSASWIINGKQRKYSSRSGTFGRVNPNKESVWEVALRRSFLDLNSSTGTITGGEQVNTTLALNWYANDNVRLMFNYIQVDTDAAAGNDDPTILQMRLQLVI